MVETCKLKTEKYRTPSLVLLTTGTKRRVTSHVRECHLNLVYYYTTLNLNVLPLGSYNISIGMDFLENHGAIINRLTKIVTCTNHEGKNQIIQGIPKPIIVRQIFCVQMKTSVRKGC